MEKKKEGYDQVYEKIVQLQQTTPAMLLNLAVTQGADVEKLSRLMDMQIRWDDRERQTAYVRAMTEFKANPPQIVKDQQVAYKEVKYKHASLANVTEKINTELSKHGLSASWTIQQNGAISVTCKITHVMGHSEETTLTAGADNSGSKNNIQAIGSTITYLQRYSLLSLTGLAAQDDDDAQSAEVEHITESQVADLKALIEETKTSLPKYVAHLKIESLDKLDVKDFQRAVLILEARRNGGAK